MDYAEEDREDEAGLTALFSSTFADSEGADEGCLIGALVKDLLQTTPDGDLSVYTARDTGALAGAICFSRLRFSQDDRLVMLLAPVAVRTNLQGRGIGQALLRFGLEATRGKGANVAVTYGDPNYYSKVGFAQVDTNVIPAPFPLSQPIGWMAQALDAEALIPLRGKARCVPAFDNPAYW